MEQQAIIVGTGRSSFMPKGREYTVARTDAELLVKKNFAKYKQRTGIPPRQK